MSSTLLSRRAFFCKMAFRRPESRPEVLVSVFLRGGADTLNLVVPHGDDEYYRQRPTIGIPQPSKSGGAVKLDDFYGLHPRLEPLLGLYRSGRLGIVQGVGTDNPTGSHFEAQDQVEHGVSYGKEMGGGWIGRHLRSRPGVNPSGLSAVAIGTKVPESLRGAPSVNCLSSLEEIRISPPAGTGDAVTAALADLYGADPTVLGTRGKETLKLLARVEDIRKEGGDPAGGAEYPEGSFGTGLREIARLIKADVGLEAAAVDLDGWDTHFIQGATSGLQAGLATKLAQGLVAFETDLADHRDRVTTVVMTEFGRRSYENASLGTDHGQGFAMMAIGSRIAGGRVHGDWPGLEEPEDVVGPGGMSVQHDYRSVLSEILTGAIGNPNVQNVFGRGFAPRPVGLVVA